MKKIEVGMIVKVRRDGEYLLTQDGLKKFREKRGNKPLIKGKVVEIYGTSCFVKIDDGVELGFETMSFGEGFNSIPLRYLIPIEDGK